MINDPRFVSQKNFDPKKCFDGELLDLARSCAKQLKADHKMDMEGIKEVQKHLFEGSYFWITGPTYESKIECQFLTELGMDVVGMSTVPEFLAASAIGVKTLGIAMVTDVMDRTEPLSHDQVLANADRAVPILKVLLLDIVKKLKLKDEIRKEIDSHIEYKGDMTKIEEFPLVQARGLIPPKEDETKEAVKHIRSIMEKTDVKEFDFGCIFLNSATYAQISQYYEVCWQIPIAKIPNVPIYTTSTKYGLIVIGKLIGSGAKCISICNLGVEGFKNFEAYFLSRIIHELGVRLMYSVVSSEWVFGGKKAVLPIAGYFYRGFVSQVKPNYQLREGLLERQKINHIIRSLNPSIYEDVLLFGYEGPIMPTSSELLTAAFLKMNAYSLCSLSILNYLVSEGILSVPITEVHSKTHDIALPLIFTRK